MLQIASHRARRTGRVVALATVALAATPALASADSIVFLKDANVFLAKGDGTGLHQVTTDGTAASPYRSPSQADDGTIAAGKGDQIVLLQQNGEVIRHLDPPALVNSTSHSVDGVPLDIALSPDGSKLAYSFVDSSCPAGADCAARQTTGYITSAGAKLPGNLFNRGNASWVTSNRTIVSGGYGAHVNLHDVGAEADVHWFDDRDWAGQAAATDLGDAELSRDGKRLAAIRGYGDSTHVIWFDVLGDARTGAPPSTPAGKCASGKQAGFSSPTWAPDGSALAWGEQGDVWVKRNPGSCETSQPVKLLAGASEPHWGPANVNPQPKPQPPAPPAPPTPPAKPQTTPKTTPGGTTQRGGSGAADGSSAGSVTVAPARLAALGGRGLRVSVPCASACKVTVDLVADAKTAKTLRLKRTRRAARTTRSLKAPGTATLALKVAPKHRRHLAKLRTAKFTAVVTIDAGGTKTTTRKALTLRK